MLPDLERLIRLQALESELQALRRTIDTEVERREAIQSAVDARKTALNDIRERLTNQQNTRRALEKDLAQVQTRLSRYKDQLMEVKTNKEYHAMQTEITAAEAEVRRFEDQILENMVASDDVAAELKAQEQDAARAEAEAKTASQALAGETAAAKERLATSSKTRDEIAGALPKGMLMMFETISRHRGAAVVEARDGHCTVCHVRLRPKVFQDVRRNDTIIQCDSCGRILYYAAPGAGRPAESAAP